nr:putative serine/threonine-protein kinase isoform X2 [Ipomoea batatas]
MLLEIVSGGPIVAFDLERGEHFLVNKAWEMYKADQLLELVDPLLEGEFPAEEAARFLKTGLLCVQETTTLRPKMSTAIKMLNNEAAIDENMKKISRPGIVADLRDVKIHKTKTSIVFPSFSP